METINLFKLSDAIKNTVYNAPLTYISDNTIIFRGEALEIIGNKAKTRRFEFQFNSPESFIENLRNFGLMLNHDEFSMVVKIYRNGNGSTLKNGNK
jgi:hypothetical protein